MSRSFLLAAVVAASALLAVSADGKDDTAPASVSIVEEKITLRQALERLTAQSHVPVTNLLPADDNPTIKLNLKDVTFWQALDGIAEAAGASLDLYQGDGRIALVRRYRDRASPLKPLVSHSGPFRVALKKLTAQNDFTSGGRGCTVVFEVAWEPALEPFYLETRPQKVVFRDDTGKSLEVSAGNRWDPVSGRRALEFDCPLPAFPRTSARIATLKGEFAWKGPSRMHAFRFRTKDNPEPTLAELEKAVAKGGIESSAGRGLTTCTLEGISLNRPSWVVRITTELPPGGAAFDSNEMWWSFAQAYLVSADGKKQLPAAGSEQVKDGVRRVEVKYVFRGERGEAKDWLLLFRAPASLVQQSIPFEFKDVPLP